jgi:class 3 adenylate cyclase
MHRDLRKLLATARGESHFVVVVFLDVRGFSSFAAIAESAASALYLQRAYLRILDHYFENADFFKPTGDGLLILKKYEPETLDTVVRECVADAVRLVDEFGSICESDPMVNFDVPSEVGIGMSRGPATALISKKKVLDYSGRPLNLASRLMDLARPSGVVFDRSLGIELLTPEIAKEFSEEQAYIKGLAEEEPVAVWALKNRTVIPEFNRRPLNRHTRRLETSEELPLKEVTARGASFIQPLSRNPASTESIVVNVKAPMPTSTGRAHAKMRLLPKFPLLYTEHLGKPAAYMNCVEIGRVLADKGVKPSWLVTLTVEYSVANGDST